MRNLKADILTVCAIPLMIISLALAWIFIKILNLVNFFKKRRGL